VGKIHRHRKTKFPVTWTVRICKVSVTGHESFSKIKSYVVGCQCDATKKHQKCHLRISLRSLICDKNMSEYGKQEEIAILAEEAKAVTLELLPWKSKEIYEKTFNEFLLCCTQKNIADRQINENVLLVYFKEESQKFCPSTLWSHNSMIRSVMVLKYGIDLKQYKLLYTFLKRQNENYKPKKLKVLERKELTQFFLQAPDEEFLMIKVSR
jgi:hypothetical protein